MGKIENGKSVSAVIPGDLYDALVARAEQEERTLGVLVRRALKAYLDGGAALTPSVTTTKIPGTTSTS